MSNSEERKLRQRLAGVLALEQGATTPGERQAASRARARLTARLDQMRGADPVARFVAAHVASLGRVPQARPEPPARLPTEGEVLGMLGRWVDGELAPREVAGWAQGVVDRVMLPTDPHEAGAKVAEVLLQLAMMHRIRLGPGDVPAVAAFLHGGDWGAWFDVVAAAARRPRERAT